MDSPAEVARKEAETRLEARKARLRDLSPHEFQLWRHHPVSVALRAYLEDYQQVLQQALLEQWRAGSLQLTLETEIRGRILAVSEMIELSWPDIQALYGLENEGEETGAESPENGG